MNKYSCSQNMLPVTIQTNGNLEHSVVRTCTFLTPLVSVPDHIVLAYIIGFIYKLILCLQRSRRK